MDVSLVRISRQPVGPVSYDQDLAIGIRPAHPRRDGRGHYHAQRSSESDRPARRNRDEASS